VRRTIGGAKSRSLKSRFSKPSTDAASSVQISTRPSRSVSAALKNSPPVMVRSTLAVHAKNKSYTPCNIRALISSLERRQRARPSRDPLQRIDIQLRSCGHDDRFWFVQVSVASQTRAANSPFLAAPTCTLTPVWKLRIEIGRRRHGRSHRGFWAWQTVAVRQESKDNASVTALTAQSNWHALQTITRGPDEFSRALAWAKVWQISP